MSLTTPPQTNARGLAVTNSSATEERFLKLVDAELTKVEKFTLEKVTELREKLNTAEQLPEDAKDEILKVADEIAAGFLRLELYVNINFMGFHKVRRMPEAGWGLPWLVDFLTGHRGAVECFEDSRRCCCQHFL